MKPVTDPGGDFAAARGVAEGAMQAGELDGDLGPAMIESPGPLERVQHRRPIAAKVRLARAEPLGERVLRVGGGDRVPAAPDLIERRGVGR